jgi:hypothetical protein
VWDQAAGKSVAQSEVLEVPIKAGWKAGTKITYAGVCGWWWLVGGTLSCCRRSLPDSRPGVSCAGKGDQEPGRPADDLVLVVSEKPHDRFTRSGNDLVREAVFD